MSTIFALSQSRYEKVTLVRYGYSARHTRPRMTSLYSYTIAGPAHMTMQLSLRTTATLSLELVMLIRSH
jgi:hypothetical protein